MSNIPTVKIKDGASFAVINQRDFDPKIHEIYIDIPKTKAKKQPSIEVVDE